MNRSQEVLSEGADQPISVLCGASGRRSASEPPILDCFGEGHLKSARELLRYSSHLNLEPFNSSTLDFDSDSSSSEAITIDESESSSSQSKAPPVRGLRPRSAHVTRADLTKFRKEVLGVEEQWYEEESHSTPINPFDSQFDDLNRAFEFATMSLNSSNGAGASGAGMFSSYAENQANSSVPSTPRQSMSSPMPHTPGQVNGGGMPGMNGSMPMNAGHQMDLRHVYDMVLELSEVLKNNREVTKSIVNSAEEIMVCLLDTSPAQNPQVSSSLSVNKANKTLETLCFRRHHTQSPAGQW